MTVKTTSALQKNMDINPTHRTTTGDYFRSLDRALATRYMQLIIAHRRRIAALARGGVNSEPMRPRMEICDVPDSPLITALFELPGLRKEEIGVHITPQGRLTISGERRAPPLLQNTEDTSLPRYPVREIKYGKYERTVDVPPGLEVSDISASLADGMLSVSWPRVVSAQTSHSGVPTAHTHAQPQVVDAA